MKAVLCLVFLLGTFHKTTVGLECPSGWMINPHHGTCVTFKNDTVDITYWGVARNKCIKDSSTLVYIDSQAMYDFIQDLVSGVTTWVDGNDLMVEGEYRRQGGQLLGFFPWRADQPIDVDGSLDCLVLAADGMDNVPCGIRRNYVCEMWPTGQRVYKGFAKMSPEMFVNQTATDIWPGTFFTANTRSKIECAALCRQNYVRCDAFLYDASTRTCSSLQVFGSKSLKLLPFARKQETVDNGGVVYFMHE